MSRQLSKFRQFKGQWYVRVAITTNKAQAKEQVRKLNNRGYHTRIVPVKHPISGHRGYAIYTKRKAS